MRGPFTGSSDVVMTVFTDIGGLAMVNWYYRGSPGIRAVASLAQITGHRMSGRFKGTGTGTVMTSATGTSGCCLIMRKRCNQLRESSGCMAGIACVAGYRMRGGFTQCSDIVMTAGTAIRSLAVVKRYHSRRPGTGIVTNLAQITGNRMRG